MLPCLSSNTASQISILDIAYLRPSKCICLLTQKTCGLTAAKDIPVLVTEEMRNFILHQIKGKVQQWKHRGKKFKTEEKFCNGVLGTRYLGPFLLHIINRIIDHDQCNKGNF